jgi:tRNA nucleotidyltransferase/poly(A) polymerase
MGKSEPEVNMLDSENYWKWVTWMEDLLVYKYLFEFLSQEQASLTTPKLMHVDHKAMSPLRSFALLPYLPGKQHAKEVWDAQRKLHSTTLHAKKSPPKDQLTDLVKEKSENEAKYRGRAQKIRQQLLQLVNRKRGC